jgi:hypothetical protein
MTPQSATATQNARNASRTGFTPAGGWIWSGAIALGAGGSIDDSSSRSSRLGVRAFSSRLAAASSSSS